MPDKQQLIPGGSSPFPGASESVIPAITASGDIVLDVASYASLSGQDVAAVQSAISDAQSAAMLDDAQTAITEAISRFARRPDVVAWLASGAGPAALRDALAAFLAGIDLAVWFPDAVGGPSGGGVEVMP